MKKLCLVMTILSASVHCCGQEFKSVVHREISRPTPTQQQVAFPEFNSIRPIEPVRRTWRQHLFNKETLVGALTIGSAFFASAGIFHCRAHFDVDHCNGQYGHRYNLAAVRIIGSTSLLIPMHYFKKWDDAEHRKFPDWVLLPAGIIGVNVGAGLGGYMHKGERLPGKNLDNP